MNDDSTEDSIDVGEWRRAFETARYGIIRHALSPETAEIAAHYMRILHEHHQPLLKFNERQQSFGRYADPLGESVLSAILPKVCQLTGLDLLPTYSYSRMYLSGGILDRHIDRPSCEVSGTLALGSDAPWPIWIDVGGDVREVQLQPGDLLVYRGCELPHWRDRCPARYSAHIFLHFVEAGGPYAHLLYDERSGLGAALAKNRPLFDPYADQGANADAPQKMPHVRRNEPCPCGSGKKFKACHGAVLIDPTPKPRR